MNAMVNFVMQSPHRIPSPPPLPLVRVRALRAAFCVHGRCVEVGEIAVVSQDAAAVLVFVGKAVIVEQSS
jgi:hypothetical protein